MTAALTLPPGRPRDPEVDKRVMNAALEQFGAEGWKGFTIEAVARRAKVSKPSIYLRWERKEDMLVDAFAMYATRTQLPEAGHVRDSIYDLALQLMEAATGLAGRARLRLRTDPELPSELTVIMENIVQEAVDSSRRLVKLGIEAGELPATVTPSLFLDCLAGAITNRAITSPLYRGQRPLKSNEEFVQELVDFLLRK